MPVDESTAGQLTDCENADDVASAPPASISAAAAPTTRMLVRAMNSPATSTGQLPRIVAERY
jgi:hypothetical protein